jgi:tetratricopeptide (TPR) repeat protein
MRSQLERQLDELDQEITKLEQTLDDVQIERSAGPVDMATVALARGGTGLAITQLADAERSSVSPAVIRPRLVDLYCNTGQPDRALELFAGVIDDPNLGTEPGAGAFRQGRVYFLLGNYLSAATLWQDRAIPRVRFDRSNRVLSAGSALTRGETVSSTDTFLALPSTLRQQASWAYELALCQLEAGMPSEAAENFTNAITLAPALAVRPIAAYYLEKMGKPVPALPKRDIAPTTPARSPVDLSVKAAIPLPGSPPPPVLPGEPSSKKE